MTNEQAKKMLKAKLECLKRETSGIDCNAGYNCDECELLYAQGTAGEQKEALKTAIKVLEQTDKIEESNFSTEQYKADLQGAYDCGYNCGYTDAMNDIAESEDEE